MKRIVIVLGVAALMAAVVAGPVAAQAERERIPFGPEPIEIGVPNLCNGESVLVSGTIRGFTQVVTTPNGETITKMYVATHGTGVGSQGNEYVFNAEGNAQLKGEAPETVTTPFVVVSKGPAPNFVLNFVFHVSPNGDVIFKEIDPKECLS
jgi:hypothetical protein